MTTEIDIKEEPLDVTLDKILEAKKGREESHASAEDDTVHAAAKVKVEAVKPSENQESDPQTPKAEPQVSSTTTEENGQRQEDRKQKSPADHVDIKCQPSDLTERRDGDKDSTTATPTTNPVTPTTSTTTTTTSAAPTTEPPAPSPAPSATAAKDNVVVSRIKQERPEAIWVKQEIVEQTGSVAAHGKPAEVTPKVEPSDNSDDQHASNQDKRPPSGANEPEVVRYVDVEDGEIVCLDDEVEDGGVSPPRAEPNLCEVPIFNPNNEKITETADSKTASTKRTSLHANKKATVTVKVSEI